jgi:hypothetical protein
MKIVKWIALLSFLSSPWTAHAAIVYDETVNGDLGSPFSTSPNDSHVIPVLTLTEGTNVVTGTISVQGVAGSPSLDLDRLFFNIQSGFQLTSIRLEVVSNSHLGTGTSWSPTVSVQNPNYSSLSSIQLDGSNSFSGTAVPDAIPGAIFLLNNGLPLTGGPYVTSINAGYGYSPSSVFNEAFGYKLSYEVAASPVPLPAAAWLLLSGLGGLAAARRRKTAEAVLAS